MILLKKTIRSMWENKGAYLACIVLITLGVCIYVAMSIACNKLLIAQDRYYEDNKLADIFAEVNAIPSSAEGVLLDIAGISEVNLRLVQDVTLSMERTDKIITMRLVSVDTKLDEPINQLNISGRKFFDERDILVSEDFLLVHQLNIGDSFQIIINGAETEFNIAGTAESPEYVYTIKDEKELLPDSEAFSVGFMSIDSMAGILGKENQFNNVVFVLENGFEYDDVKLEIEDVLSPYGLTALYPREDQISYVMLKGEIDSNISMATSIPFVFILIAVIVLYLMLKRVMEQDRSQIGTLKAFGYSNREIMVHYISYGVITGVTGAVIGVITGYYLSEIMSGIYNEFFKLPPVEMDFIWSYIVNGLLIGIIGAIAGAYMGAKSVMKLNPAEAMRPAAPKMIKNDIFNYLPFLRMVFNSKGNMAVRSIIRNKFRSAFIVIGMMFSFGLLAFIASYSTMIDDILLNHFTKVQIFDGKVNLNQPISYNEAIEAVYGIEGIILAEGILEMPVKLHFENRNESINIIGISGSSQLYKVYDSDKRRTRSLSDKGIILTDAIAAKLEVTAGDVIRIESALIPEDKEIVVTDIVTQYLGSSSYMDMKSMQKIFETGDYVTGVIFTVEDMVPVKELLKEGKNVGFLEDIRSTYNNYAQLMGSYGAMMSVMEIMAAGIAFAIIYNTAVISLSERKREYATLRVLGMQVDEVGDIMGLEYWILTAFGIILGIPFTYFLKTIMGYAMEMEMFTMPTYTPPASFFAAGVGCIISVWVSNRFCIRNIRCFDMVEVLKERE